MTSLTLPLTFDWALTAQIIWSRHPLPWMVLLTPIFQGPLEAALAVPAITSPATRPAPARASHVGLTFGPSTGAPPRVCRPDAAVASALAGRGAGSRARTAVCPP